jgi:hypothetical protein
MERLPPNFAYGDVGAHFRADGAARAFLLGRGFHRVKPLGVELCAEDEQFFGTERKTEAAALATLTVDDDSAHIRQPSVLDFSGKGFLGWRIFFLTRRKRLGKDKFRFVTIQSRVARLPQIADGLNGQEASRPGGPDGPLGITRR